MAVQGLWDDTLPLGLEVVADCGERFSFRIPLSFNTRLDGRDVSAFRWGVMVDYRPFDSGLFLSLGMFQSAYLFGSDKPQEDHLYLNEIAIGWRQKIGSWAFVEPKLVLSDPTGVFATERALWKQAMGEETDVRFSLVAGIAFPSFLPSWEERYGQEE